eukprot:c20173_g1_i3.p1 GENE.c20173_g1_i3~~c20173_g1_i3.p1  ORF type:complete len:403 (+),score=32.73 c20173_g1_i3:158-1210(+)
MNLDCFQGIQPHIFEQNTTITFYDETLPFQIDEKSSSKSKYIYFYSVTDIFIASYLFLSSWPYFISPFSNIFWTSFHLLYFLLLVFVQPIHSNPKESHRLVRLLSDYHCLIFFSIGYSELQHIISLTSNGYFHDQLIQEIEETIFGCQLSQELHQWIPFHLLGEYFCICYLGYFVFIFLLLCCVGICCSHRDFHICSSTLVFSFIVNFFIFTYFPVEGPFWQLSRVDPSKIGYRACHLVHLLLSNGSAHGTAFPSSHVGIALTIWILSIKYHKKLSLFYLLVIPALCIATVYGGFHYGFDAICGSVVGTISSLTGHHISKKLVSFTHVGSSTTKETIFGVHNQTEEKYLF